MIPDGAYGRCIDLRRAGRTIEEIADSLRVSRLDVFRTLLGLGLLVDCGSGRGCYDKPTELETEAQLAEAAE